MTSTALESLPLFAFDTARRAWVQCATDGAGLGTADESVRLASWNVLYEASQRSHVARPDLRYPAVAETLRQRDADVIGLNEVSSSMLDVLLEAHWVRRDYLLSKVVSERMHMENLLLIHRRAAGRAQLFRLLTTSVPRRRPCLLVTLQTGRGALAVATAHLTAMARNAERRKRQLDEIFERIDGAFSAKLFAAVLMGDLNLHNDFEDAYIARPAWVDLWPAVHGDDDPGFTWDAPRNSLVGEAYGGFERRKMRLDRIVVRDTAGALDVAHASMEIFGDVAINEDASRAYGGIGTSIRRLLSFVLTPVAKTLTADPYSYLFPSDHFGLAAELPLAT